MRLLRADTDELILETVHDESQQYAILSQRWLAEEEEILFNDVTKSRNGGGGNLQSKADWNKLQWFRAQAVRDGLRYVWADTCCIDKRSSQELTESINSMYRWYQNVKVCYVYLHDMPDRDAVLEASEETSLGDNAGNSIQTSTKPRQVSLLELGDVAVHSTETPNETSPLLRHVNPSDLEAQRQLSSSAVVPAAAPSEALQGWNHESFARAQWFTRAWTLQEMIGPRNVRFYNKSWTLIGKLQHMAPDIARITGVHEDALTKKRSLKSYSIAQKMSWAADRQCTKIEDQAYSLLGIMEVSMVANYGEGNKAFQRLQDELLRTSSDDSIFAFEAFSRSTEESRSLATLLAGSPGAFRGCEDVTFVRWRDEPNQHQLVGKEVSFRMRMRRTHGTVGNQRIKYHQAILQCCREQGPSTMIVLNLDETVDTTGVFHVQGYGPRIESLRIREGKWSSCQFERFTVVRASEKDDGNRYMRSQLLLCECKTSDVKLQPLYASPHGTWHAADSSFTILGPYRDSIPFDANLAIVLDGIQQTTLNLRIDDIPIANNFPIKFAQKSIHLPAWPTLPLGRHMYGCSITRTPKSILVARSYYYIRYLGHLNVFLLEIEHPGPLRLLWLTVFQVVISLPTCCLAYACMLASNITWPQFSFIIVALWQGGRISSWVTMLLFSIMPMIVLAITRSCGEPERRTRGTRRGFLRR